MAEAEKSRGLKFAERQLRRHGWEHGKGLGRAENGIVDAIKVKVKCDKGGVGHKEGEQFTFHWWDHVFNKASSSLQVESDQDGITLKKTADEDEDEGMISNKKPRKAALAKAKLYGCFVKSSTLLSGQEQPEPKPDSGANDASSSSSSSDEEEEDRRLDLSSTTQLSDAELMKVCGGRTAHKGARHGLTMSAKLARLEQQDAEFMAKYGGKSRPAATSPAVAASSRAELTEAPGGKRKKQKRPTESAELDGGDRPESPETQPQKKKKKKQKAAELRTSPAEETPEEAEDRGAEVQKKKKKKKKRPEPAEEESRKSSHTTPEDGEVTAATERRKRKKSKKDKVMMDEDASEEARPPPEKKKKKKKKCKD